MEVLLKHVRQQPPPARSLVPSISDAVDAVLAVALQKRIDDRFASVEAMSNAYLTAVTMAPVASPVARTVSLHLSPTTDTPSIENPQTPLPLYAGPSVADPHTPLPPYVTFGSSQVGLPLPTQEDSIAPQENFSPVSPLLPLPDAFDPEEPDVDQTEIRDKSFLQELEDEVQRTSLFWSSEPPEWSPIASKDERSSNEANTTSDAIPATASEYLHSKVTGKPLITRKLEDTPSVEQSEPEPTESAHRNESAKPVEPTMLATPTLAAQPPTRVALSPAERLKKWLPIIVVILLLLGLLGAVLSSFFFPATKPETNSLHTAQSAGSITAATATLSTSATITTAAQKKPISTVATTSHPTTPPSTSPSPTPLPTNPSVPPFACTDGTITVDGTSEFSAVMQQVQADYTTQCSTNSVTMNINANGSTASLNSVASGSSDLAYSDLTSANRPGLVDYQLAAQTYAVVVNSDTNITQLTTAQLQGIYSGTITNWSQVGGTDEPIVIINRTQGSAIRILFEQYVIQAKQTVAAPVLWPDTTDIVMKKLLATSGSLSYVALGAVPTYGVQSVAINGVAPDTTAVSNGTYPFWGMIHLYSNHTTSSLALSLISFFTTMDGQNDLAAYGAIDIKNVPQSVLSTHLHGPQG